MVKGTAGKACLCLLLIDLSLWLTACGSSAPSADLASQCASLSSTSLENYDRYSSRFLNDKTKHPPWNLNGEVVWGTRYYLESLVTAYEATNNPKYLKAFEDSGSWVMSKAQTISFVDVPDPSAPGKVVNQPLVTLTGWPTQMGDFGTPVSIPTASGAVALYAQSLDPRASDGASFLKISQLSGGTLQFAWWRDGQNLQTYPIASISDLYSIAAQPLVYRQSPGRIKPTGLGLPAVGSYELDTPLTTIWHTEQTGGILLPFVRFLLIAKKQPGVVDPALAASWQSTVLQIASQVASEYVSDGNGGYVLQNPYWMASTLAGTYAESDYVWAETSLRILLYELTTDPNQLTLARGLLQHQIAQNVPVNSNGWLVLREWPDIRPWSTRSEAPLGSVWDQLDADPSTPEDSTLGGFFVEMLHLANSYGLSSALGLPASLFAEQNSTFHEYLLIPNALGLGLPSPMRAAYPTLHSSVSDPLAVGDDIYATSGYLEPETSSAEDWEANWQWMLTQASAPQGWPIGYFLRAWARSEAAFAQACQIPPAN